MRQTIAVSYVLKTKPQPFRRGEGVILGYEVWMSAGHGHVLSHCAGGWWPVSPLRSARVAAISLPRTNSGISHCPELLGPPHRYYI